MVCEGGRASGDARIWSKSGPEAFRKKAEVLGVRWVDTMKGNGARSQRDNPLHEKVCKKTCGLPDSTSLMTLTSVKRLRTGV